MTDAQATTSSTRAMGVQITAQSKNDMDMPMLDCSMPMAITFIDDPEGSASPPMHAA